MRDAKEEGAVRQEGPQEIFIALDHASLGASGVGEGGDLEEGPVGQRIELEEAPEILDRVELRSVGR